MLSKSVCKKCMNERAKQLVAKMPEHNVELLSWQKEDDNGWKNGRVECPTVYSKGFDAKINASPPDHCPYILEHVISNDNE